MTPSPKDILFGVVATAAGVGALVVLNRLLGEELLTYVLLATLLGLMAYFIAFLSASNRREKRLKREQGE